MVSLGLARQKSSVTAVKTSSKEARQPEDKDSKEALKKIAASALAAAKDTTNTSKEGKIVVCKNSVEYRGSDIFGFFYVT